jgi:hypothetical protein
VSRGWPPQADRALGILLGRFTAAQGAEAAAGQALQSLMAPTGLPPTLTSAQAASATRTVLSKLRALGLGRGRTSALLGVLHVAPPSDWLLALSS